MVAQDTPEGLAHQMKGAERISLTVEAPAAPLREKILAVDGVLDVQAEEKGEVSTCSVECRLGSDLRRVLARQIVDEGWGLLELRAVSMSLEDVFINLITQE